MASARDARRPLGRRLLAGALILQAIATNLYHTGKLIRAHLPHAVDEILWNIASQSSSDPIVPVIYDDIDELPRMVSSGPRHVLPGKVGLYEFSNVCLAKHFKEPTLTGLVYFSPDDDAALATNPKRCAACSAPLDHDGGWNGTGRDEEDVQHKCGFEGIHAMFASSVVDWADCRSRPEAREQAEIWEQLYVPGSDVHRVHYYNEPMFHLAFDGNIGHDLFDHLLNILPYWHAFRERKHFPFRGVTSLYHEGCMTDDSGWYCEVLRAMNAFGPAVEVYPPGHDRSDDRTMYCYKNVTVNHLAVQRSLDEPIPKHMFDDLRELLFEKFGLEREREFHSKQERNVKRSRKILLYAHEPSGRRVWVGMNDLIEEIREKYDDVMSDVVDDFGAYSVREQAQLFNGHDAHIMVHGAQMANSIFAVDQSLFVEVGCEIPEFIGNPEFMRLIEGHHILVENCEDSGDGDEGKPCVVCDTDDWVYGNFTMASAGFRSLVDEVLREMDRSRVGIA